MVRRQLFLCTRGSHIIYRLKNKESWFAFFHGRTANGSLQLSSQVIFGRLCETGRSSHRRWLFQSYLFSRCASPQLMETRGERMGRAARGPSLLWGQQAPSTLPPTDRNRSLRTPQILFWPCKTLKMFNVPESGNINPYLAVL